MIKLKNSNMQIYIISALITALMVCIVLLGTQFLTNKEIETIKISHAAEAESLKNKILEYRDSYNDVLDIKNQYRSSIRELVRLLYNKEAPFATGGHRSTIVESTDEIILLEIRNTINTMQDDQMILNDIKNYLNARKTFIENFPFIWPVATGGVPRVTSGYGFREDLFNTGFTRFHEGIDIAGSIGDEIVATADGEVLYVVNDKELGKIIVLQHQHGITTGYAHLNKILVKAGQSVSRGEVIGHMGNTGSMSQGPHLHYEIRKDRISIDPMNYLSINY